MWWGCMGVFVVVVLFSFFLTEFCRNRTNSTESWQKVGAYGQPTPKPLMKCQPVTPADTLGANWARLRSPRDKRKRLAVPLIVSINLTWTPSRRGRGRVTRDPHRTALMVLCCFSNALAVPSACHVTTREELLMMCLIRWSVIWLGGVSGSAVAGFPLGKSPTFSSS